MFHHVMAGIAVVLFTLAIGAPSIAQTKPTGRPATRPAGELVLVIVGDSTVCDYPAEHVNRGWGQYVGEWFEDGSVKIINLAASGRSTKTFISEGRWQKALDEKPDYVFIQFGHNDSHAPDKPEATNAETDYKDFLKRYIAESRAAGAVPVLITPMVRRDFNAEGKIAENQATSNLVPFVKAMKEVANRENVVLIDLYATSKSFSEKLGPDASLELASKPGDKTHFNEKGARAMADLLMRDVATSVPALNQRMKPALQAHAVAPTAPKTIYVTTVGVVGDGTTKNTAAIQKAIDDCSAGGGGVVRFPEGRYLTGTIQIKSNVTLYFDEKSTLLGSTDAADYQNLDPFIDGSGNPLGHALIVALDAANVGIEGAGTIDGQSPALKANQMKYTMRPFLVRWVRCSNVVVRDIHLTNPGAWTLNFFQTKGALIQNVTIRSRDLKMPNNDGVNIDSSEDVQVRDCDVNSGDDALVIKATSRSKPSRNIVASNCRLSTHTNAIKLGTESIGGFENITISHCDITRTQMSGIALYQVDGADLKNVTISDVMMDDVTVPISIRLGARLKTFREGEEPRPEPGHIRHVTIRNVTAKKVGMIGMLINGVPGHPVESLTLENVHLELPGGGTAEDAKVELPEKEKAYPEFNTFGKVMPAYGIYARHARGIEFKNVTMTKLKDDARPATVFIDVENRMPADFSGEAGKGK